MKSLTRIFSFLSRTHYLKEVQQWITANIAHMNMSKYQSLHSWSLICVVKCGVFLSSGSSHIVQNNIWRNSSETRMKNLGHSSWLQLGG